MKMNKASAKIPFLTFQATLLLVFVMADPRAQTINYTCSSTRAVHVPNFVSAMNDMSEQIQTRGFGISVKGGSGPDTIYAYFQCYGDLSLVDSAVCNAQARMVFPQCYGRIFLDGCFMRAERYNFFYYYNSPLDKAVCGNRTRQGVGYETEVKKAVLRAADAARVTVGIMYTYTMAEERVMETGGGSVYVLANCWTTLNANNCRACLAKASASMLGCLPMFEARVLNTGCFMRYSDVDFLNKEPNHGSSRGRIISAAVSVVSYVIVLAVGIIIGGYIWEYSCLRKKTGGSDHD